MNLSHFFNALLEKKGVQSQVQEIAGYQTHSLSAGNGAAHLFWFPAAGDSASGFGQALVMLAKDLSGIANVMAVDPPGYGESTFPLAKEFLSFTELSNWAEELVAPMKGPVILIGNSSGGILATAAALAKQKQAAGLILVAWPDWRFGIPPHEELCPKDSKALRRLLSRSWHRPPKLNEADLLNMLPQFTNQNYINHIRSFNAKEFSIQLDKFQGNLTFIGGDSDQLVPFSSLESSAASRNHSKLYCIREAGHYPHKEQAKRFVDVLVEIVNQNLLSTSNNLPNT